MLYLGLLHTQALISQENPKTFELGASLGANHYIKNTWTKNDLGLGLNARFTSKLRLSWLAQLSYSTLSGETHWRKESYSFSQNTVRLDWGLEYHWHKYASNQKFRQAKNWTPFVSLGLGTSLSWQNKVKISPHLYLGFGAKYRLNNKLHIIGTYTYYYTLTSPPIDLESDLIEKQPRNVLRHGTLYGGLSIGISWILWNNELNCR